MITLAELDNDATARLVGLQGERAYRRRLMELGFLPGTPVRMVRNIAIRLGAPAIPGQDLRFTGTVTGKESEGDECVLEVTIGAANDLGDHATGTVTVTLPLG